ncbi:MAG: hypothetical protein Q4E47_02205, partial [Candidatus Saccharibacteria bacterium]|nr:hypothetical protein [Candidatus Saccharibacteria bacterium]
MRILGIETSCDETAASVVEDGKKILSNVVVSQIDIFAEYGGVIPEVASRSHLEVIQPVIKKALLDFIDGLIASRTPLKLNSNARVAYDYRSSTEPYIYLSELPDKDRLDIAWDNIDAIAVTHTPGLLGSLLIGTLTARTLAILHDKPLYATHHLKSHIYANWLDTGDIKEHYLKY